MPLNQLQNLITIYNMKIVLKQRNNRIFKARNSKGIKR